jgi:hypothetical protein
MRKITYLLLVVCCLFSVSANAAKLIATANGMPITDSDITARTRLMALQGNTGADNRRKALQNIIDDGLKISYAQAFGISPTEKEVTAEEKRIAAQLGALEPSTKVMLNNAIRAEIAWHMYIGRVIIPQVNISDDDVAAEKRNISKERGLPINVTFIRLSGIPDNIASKLSAPKNCDDAEKIAREFGGEPMKMTAPEYELSEDIRARLSGLSPLQWSVPVDRTVLLLCNRKNMKEFDKIDDVIKQNATYKKATFQADQQLKQLRRKAVVVISDPAYK